MPQDQATKDLEFIDLLGPIYSDAQVLVALNIFSGREMPSSQPLSHVSDGYLIRKHPGENYDLMPLISLPISVTTASYQGPSMTGQQEATQKLAQMAGVRPETMLTDSCLKSLTVSPVGDRSATNAPVKPSFSGGGITLPREQSVQKTKSSTKPSSKLPAATTRLYSSASQAHVKAMDRRVNGAPVDMVHASLPKKVPASEIHQKGGKFKYFDFIGGKASLHRRISVDANMNMSPQVFLDSLLRSRGYCTNKYCSLEGAYYNKPTPLQEASYGMRIAQTVRGIDASHLEKLLRCGLSPNPCNAFGESIVHMACRRGDIKILQVLLDAGSSVQVTDDFGRTPLHDACWTSQPKFDIVETIIQKDPHLINIVDCRGSSPLSYVRREHWEEWISFIQSIVNKYWPPRDKEKEGEQPPPPLTLFSPDSRPIKDPPNALSEEMAHLVSSGKVEPDDILS